MEGGTKEVAPRKRATISCIECHRRRKKCSQGQPCRNCTRRYPPVECIYTKPKRVLINANCLLPQSDFTTFHNADDVTSNDGIAGASNTISLKTAPPLISQPSNQFSAPLEAETARLPRQASNSMISILSRPGQQGNEKEVKEYSFNASSCPMSDMSCFMTKSPASVDLDDDSFPARTVPGEPNQTRAMILSHLSQAILPLSLGCGTLDLLPKLSVEATTYNAELFYIHNQILLPRIWSIDGLDECPKGFWDAWIPFSTFSPVLLHANLLRASVWRESMRQSSAMKMEYHAPVVENALETLSLRLKVVNLLNARLRNGQLDDECVTSVAFFFFTEFCSSDSHGLQGTEPHARGLREMVKIRGGLHTLGASGNIAKLVMLCHYHLATVFEREAFIVPSVLLQDDFVPSHMTGDRSFDSPLFLSYGSFAEKAKSGELLLITARILDEMTYIISQISRHCYVKNPDFEWNSLLVTTSNIRDHISSLPSASETGLTTTDDFMYECVRIAALVNCRAIISKLPFSIACRQEDHNHLFIAMSRVSLSRWKQSSGVWIWILLTMNPRARNSRDGIRLRYLMKICAFSNALREWQILVNIMEAFMALQRWIRETDEDHRVPNT